MKVRLISIAAGIVLPACATSSIPGDVPAVLVDPTPGTRAELRLAVQRALHSEPVLLADDALTRSSLLPIDRIARRDPQGRLLNGLEIGHRPEIFRLVRNGAHCVLIHDDTEQLRQTLAAAKCKPAPGKS